MSRKKLIELITKFPTQECGIVGKALKRAAREA